MEADIDVGLDKVSGIAHNKVMIIDEKIVITDSFNFTRAADSRNAENVIIIDDSVIPGNIYKTGFLVRQKINQHQDQIKKQRNK